MATSCAAAPLAHAVMPISCHFRDCKALLVTSVTHVSGAIASAQTFTFTLYYSKHWRPIPIPNPTQP